LATNCTTVGGYHYAEIYCLEFFHGHEAWNEFRRTGYPKIVNGSQVATETFASVQSGSPRADKLPIRNLYPQTEINLNVNVPKLTNGFSDQSFGISIDQHHQLKLENQ
jgi:hypothetical protein